MPSSDFSAWTGGGSNSALYYYRARTYDPKVGRFLQADKIPPTPEEMNRFVYTGNNPVNATDPSGLETYLCHRKIGGKANGTRGAHTYVCVYHNGKYRCDSTDKKSLTNPEGKPNPDDYNPGNCDLVQGKDDCMENCLINKMDDPTRPYYGTFPISPGGTNCKKWSSDAINDCYLQCVDR